MAKLILSKRDGKLPVLQVDGRTTPRAPNLKHLRFSKKLPLRCDECRFRPQDNGGEIGGCSKYKEGSLCVIRNDIRKEIEKYSSDNPDIILPLLQEEFEATYEFLKFTHALESMRSELNPEVSRRMNALTNLGKLIGEFKRQKVTVEAEQKETLTDGKKTEIAQTLRKVIEAPIQ